MTRTELMQKYGVTREAGGTYAYGNDTSLSLWYALRASGATDKEIVLAQAEERHKPAVDLGISLPSLPTLPAAIAAMDKAFGRTVTVDPNAPPMASPLSGPPHPALNHQGKWRRHKGHWCKIERVDAQGNKATLWGRDARGNLHEGPAHEWDWPTLTLDHDLAWTMREHTTARAMTFAPRDGFDRAQGPEHDLFARGVAAMVEEYAGASVTEIVAYASTYVDPPRAQPTRPVVSKAPARGTAQSVGACLSGRTGRYQ